MRRIFTIVILTYNLCNAQEAEINVKSKIDQVTVFLEGAQVTRQATVSLKPGVSVLTFSGIAPGIQEQSIQSTVSPPLRSYLFLFG